MSQISFEQVVNAVRTLSPAEMARLREIVNESNGKPQREEAAPAAARAVDSRDLSHERRWLAEHCDEYVGQWVALVGDQLISHGPRRREVAAATIAAGYPDALIAPVERVRYVPPVQRSPEELAELRRIIIESNDSEQRAAAARELMSSARDFSGEHDWLAEHRNEYVGQWVALMGNRLLSHGPRLKEVRAAAIAAGYPDALCEQITLKEPDVIWK